MGEKATNERILPLWDHINELSKLLKAWIYTFLIATILLMVLPADASFLSDPLSFYKPLISVIILYIKARLLPPNVLLIAGSFTAPIELYLIASVVFGLIVSLPVLAYEGYRFIDPALKPNERKAVYPFVTAFTLLFAVGAIFAFEVLLPFIVLGTLVFLPITGAAPFVNIEDFYTLVFYTILMTGIAFTLPVFIVILAKFQIIETSRITKNRTYLWVGTYILTAIITPDGGPIADVALFVPIILLLEGSLFIARRYEKNRPPKGRKSEQEDLTCRFCSGPIDSGGVFCGRCGRSRL